MKRRDFSVAALAACSWGGSAMAQGNKKPEEGIEYVSLDKRVPTEVADGKVEVIEFFWYSCPHCNAFEPQFKAWIERQSKDVVVKRVPVHFREDFEPQQRMYFTLEALGKVDALHAKVFQAIHVDRLPLNNAEQLAAWAAKNGIVAKDFNQASHFELFLNILY